MPVYHPKSSVPVLNAQLAKELGVVFALPLTERGGNPRDVVSQQAVTNSGAVWGTGPYGPQLDFNGSTHYLSYPDNSALQLTHSLSIHAIVRSDTGGAIHSLVTKGSTQSDNYNYQVRQNEGKLEYLWRSGPDNVYTSTDNIITAGLRFVVSVSHVSGGTPVLYVNGAPVPGSMTSGSASNPLLSFAQPLEIGREPNRFYWEGGITSLLVCNRALTQNQISRLCADPWALYQLPLRKVFYSYAPQVIHDLAGTIAGQATASAALARLRGIAGTCAAQATLSGDATRNRGLTGTIAATATATGTLSRLRGLVGAIAGTATLSGALARIRRIAGIISAALTATGNLTVVGAHILAPTSRRARILFENRTATVQDEDD